MCLLCVAEPGKTPTRQQLLNAADNNPHGYGFAFHLESTILTGRGMDAEEVIDRFLRIREVHPNSWAMFHARYTTHGATNKGNCHPFRIGGSDKLVLAHNGILPIDVPHGDNRSDTRIFAEDFLPDLGIEALDDPEMFEQMERWMGGSKVVVFSADPRTEYKVYFLNGDLGHEVDGIWWSNDGHKYSWSDIYSIKNKSKYSYDYHTQTESVMPDEMYEIEQMSCDLCRSPLSMREFEANSCINCNSCLDCFEDIADCLCYHSRGKGVTERDYYNDRYAYSGGSLYNFDQWGE